MEKPLGPKSVAGLYLNSAFFGNPSILQEDSVFVFHLEIMGPMMSREWTTAVRVLRFTSWEPF